MEGNAWESPREPDEVSSCPIIGIAALKMEEAGALIAVHNTTTEAMGETSIPQPNDADDSFWNELEEVSFFNALRHSFFRKC